ncbi:MAG: NAD(P)H-dependent oxidoreductase [Phyllobacterium sp.]|uniref:NADPH-dependent FMN reductase n=1 Tax=Phyllobacterium sp. TaxID=1871046 RepID=UPI0030F0A1D4
MALKLNIIIASTRPGRGGPAVAKWFHEFARQDARFETVPRSTCLSLTNRIIRACRNERAHTKRWSTIVDAADATVFVTPEYDYFAPPSLINALIYLSKEWNYKPAGFVSYGGVSGGLRSVESVKGLVAGLRMMPIPDGVPVHSYQQFIDDEGVFQPTESMTNSATTMLAELAKWAAALKPLRA